MLFSLFHKLVDNINPDLVPLSHLENKGAYSSVQNLATLVNDAFYLVLIISVVLLTLVTFFMVYFAVRYRRKKNPVPREVKEPLLLEITWTVIPTILVLIMFYVGWINFVPLRRAPQGAMPVQVTARMWSWQFEYENGLKSPTLNVPAGKAIKLLLNSKDVIHSLFIPDFRIKEDVVPGLENYLWLNAEKEGEFDIFCAEYCGRGHSSMSSKVIVMAKKEFHEWYEREEEVHEIPGVPHEAAELIEDNGCLDCHSMDGSANVGPTFKGLFGRKEIILSKGKKAEIIVDESYIRKSILHPAADIVEGYPDVMPSYDGELSDKELNAVIEYVKGLK